MLNNFTMLNTEIKSEISLIMIDESNLMINNANFKDISTGNSSSIV